MSTGFLKAAALLLVLGPLGGCVAPGAPQAVSVPSNIAAAFPDCRFVDPQSSGGEFITSYYLTTYGSAFAEGATAGGNSGLQSASDFAAPLRSLASRPFILSGENLVPTGASAPPICMLYSSSGTSKAISAARSTLRAYGYGTSSVPNGLRTSWRRGAHESANWFDRYTIVVAPIGSGQSVAMVRREVYIQRAGFAARFDEDGSFYEATSVGANETWLLAYMRDAVR